MKRTIFWEKSQIRKSRFWRISGNPVLVRILWNQAGSVRKLPTFPEYRTPLYLQGFSCCQRGFSEDVKFKYFSFRNDFVSFSLFRFPLLSWTYRGPSWGLFHSSLHASHTMRTRRLFRVVRSFLGLLWVRGLSPLLGLRNWGYHSYYQLPTFTPGLSPLSGLGNSRSMAPEWFRGFFVSNFD